MDELATTAPGRTRLVHVARVGAAAAVIALVGAGAYAVGQRNGEAAGRRAALADVNAADLAFARMLSASDTAVDAPDLAALCESRGNAMSRPTPECADLAGPKAQRPFAVTDPALQAITSRYAASVMTAADRAGGDPRTLSFVRAAETAVAAPARVAGVADVDGDGLDDDGMVEITSGAHAACVLLPLSPTYGVDIRPTSCGQVGGHPGLLSGDDAYGPKRFPRSYLETL